MKRIAFMIGDPSGIGPEITVRCLEEYPIPEDIQILLVGDRRSFDRARHIIGSNLAVTAVTNGDPVSGSQRFSFLDIPVEGDEEIPFGAVSRAAGAEVYKSLQKVLGLIDKKLVDGFVFAPFNKEALKKGGCPYPSELEMFKAHFNRPDVPGEISFADPIWTCRVTSHIAVKDISSYMEKERILGTVEFLYKEMQRFGLGEPRIAVSALNPHGGEKGMFGTEEITDIEPAVRAARDLGIEALGPYPADTIFLRLRDGEFDAVVSMYHDQGQVATKLLGFDRGVSIHGGMPVAIATCAHGTAFDIAGTGKARPTALIEALKVVRSSLSGTGS